jgi:hypothetical protein
MKLMKQKKKCFVNTWDRHRCCTCVYCSYLTTELPHIQPPNCLIFEYHSEHREDISQNRIYACMYVSKHVMYVSLSLSIGGAAASPAGRHSKHN